MNLPTKSTPEKLLETACELFTSKGFRAVSIAELCEASGANIAAVNYHFGNKESLYKEVWRYAEKMACTTWPIRKEEGTAKERLRFFIDNTLKRIFDTGPAGTLPRLIVRELADPTPALADITENIIAPLGEYLHSLVTEILDSKADDQTIRNHMHSIIGQYVFYAFCRPVHEIREARNDIPPSDPVQLAEHIYTFSMAGLNATRSRLNQ